MDLDKFIENFSYQFDDTPVDDFSSETVYEELEEWSSLIALSVIAMVDQNYNVNIGADEIIEGTTIKGLYEIICSKK